MVGKFRYWGSKEYFFKWASLDNYFPYTKLREDISILLLRAKYDMAKESVEEKKEERMRDAIDEYYAFKNEFPESKYIKEVENIYKDAKKYVKEINE